MTQWICEVQRLYTDRFYAEKLPPDFPPPNPSPSQHSFLFIIISLLQYGSIALNIFGLTWY